MDTLSSSKKNGPDKTTEPTKLDPEQEIIRGKIDGKINEIENILGENYGEIETEERIAVEKKVRDATKIPAGNIEEAYEIIDRILAELAKKYEDGEDEKDTAGPVVDTDTNRTNPDNTLPTAGVLSEEARHLIDAYERGLPILFAEPLLVAKKNNIPLDQNDDTETIINKLRAKRDGKVNTSAPLSVVNEEEDLKQKRLRMIALQTDLPDLIREPKGSTDIIKVMKAELERLEKEIGEADTKERLAREAKDQEKKDAEAALKNLTQKDSGSEKITTSDEIQRQFEEDFSFSEEEIKKLEATIEGEDGKEKTIKWTDLSAGQQFTLLQNLKEFALDNAKEQALKKYTEGEKKSFEDAEGVSGWITRAWLGATKTYRRAYELSRIEKEVIQEKKEPKSPGLFNRTLTVAAKWFQHTQKEEGVTENKTEEAETSNKEIYKEVLQEMLGMAIDAPEMEIVDGKTRINFALTKDFSAAGMTTPEATAAVEEFNRSAHEFAQIPSEWAYSDDPHKLEKYNAVKSDYSKARGEILKRKAEYLSDEDASDYVAALDKQVHFTQLFNADPDIEKIFASIIDEKSLWKAVSRNPLHIKEYWEGIKEALYWNNQINTEKVGDKFDAVKEEKTLTETILSNPFDGKEYRKGISIALGQKSSWRGLKAATTERGGLMMMGGAVRTGGFLGAAALAACGAGLASSLPAAIGFGAVQGAVSGSLLGSYVAGKRADLEISDKKELAKMGVLDETNKNDYRAASETGDIFTAERDKATGEVIKREKIGELGVGLLDKLEYAINRAREAEDDDDLNVDKRDLALRALGDRLYYTEQKLFESLVNFGEGKDSLKNRYELDLALNTARILLGMNEPDMVRNISLRTVKDENGKFVKVDPEKVDPAVREVQEKINKLLQEKAGEVASKDKKYKKEKVRSGIKNGLVLGALFGAGFSWYGYTKTHTGEGATTTSETPKTPGNTQRAETVAPIAEKTPATNEVLPATKGSNTADELLTKLKVTEHSINPVTPKTPVQVPVSQTEQPVQFAPAPEQGGILQPGAAKFGKGWVDESSIRTGSHPLPSEPIKPSWQWAEIKAEHLRESVEKSVQKLSETYTVKPGDNIWNVLKSRLGNNEYFNQLSPREKNFVIDGLKDRITHLNKGELLEMGIKSKNPHLINPGDKIDFSKVIADKNTDLMRIFSRAQNISSHGAAVHTNPTETISSTTGGAEDILKPAPIPKPVEVTNIHPFDTHQTVQPSIETVIAPETLTSSWYKNIGSPEEAAVGAITGKFMANGLINEIQKNSDGTVNPKQATNSEENSATDTFHSTPHTEIPEEYRGWTTERIFKSKKDIDETLKKNIVDELYNKKIIKRVVNNGIDSVMKLIRDIATIFEVELPTTGLDRQQRQESIGEYLEREAWKQDQINGKKERKIPDPKELWKIFRPDMPKTK